ncbi:MAG TPA: DMT family transporter [Chitinophagaceae bacterium]|nr:DMT family transporter [Chitinophagaceae bacterium]
MNTQSLSMSRGTVHPSILLLMAVLFWGANYHLTKAALTGYPVFVVAAIRFGVGFLLIWSYFTGTGIKFLAYVRQKPGTYLSVSMLAILFNILFFLGISRSTAFNASIMGAFSPAIMILLSGWLLKLRIRTYQAAGLVIGMTGVLISLSGGSLAKIAHMHFSSGDLLLLGASISFSLYSVLSHKLLAPAEMVVGAALNMLVSALLFTFVAWYTHPDYSLSFNFWPLTAAISMGIFGTFLAYVFWLRGIASAGTYMASLLYNLIPLFTYLISVAAGQSIGLPQTLGGLLIVSGILLAQLLGNRPR